MSDVKIYTSATCPFCHAARHLIASLGAPYQEIALDENPELRQSLSQQLQGWRTVPMVFIGDEFIGGFEDLMRLHQAGELRPKLAAVATGTGD